MRLDAVRRPRRTAVLLGTAISLVAILLPGDPSPVAAPAASAQAAVAPGPSLAVADPAVVARPARPWWKRKLDDLVAGKAVGVSLREEGTFLYRHADKRRRIPASNQKLLMAMVLLDVLGPSARLPTRAAVSDVNGSVVQGDLWILGRGDPVVGRGKLGRLARRISNAGITRIKGSVKGSTGYFRRDWWVSGWKSYFPRDHIPLPTALTWQGNAVRGVHVDDPERRAAKALTEKLEKRGIRVDGSAGAGPAPAGLEMVAEVRSSKLIVLLRKTLRASLNFHAEVLGKRLGAAWLGPRGTIAKGATAVEEWAQAVGVGVHAHDASGLSYQNAAAPAGLTRLLGSAEGAPWGGPLRMALPAPGHGTLKSRLKGVRVRAKTGTLRGVSALSGWVWLTRRATWAEFSIISSGMSKSDAVALEDAVVRLMWSRAR